MDRRKFTKTIMGIVPAALIIPSIVNADQETKNDEATLAEIKGFHRGYLSCLIEIRTQTEFSPKKCFEYDGVMYIAGIRGRVL